MKFISLDSFIRDQGQAYRLSKQYGVPFNEALRAVVRNNQEEESQRQSVQKGVPTAQLLEAMNKFAAAKKKKGTLGAVPRDEMPQLKAERVQRDASIPTGDIEFIAPGKLKKTQEKVNKTKVRGIADRWETMGKKPVLISRDNWILDGHHRVAAAESLGKLVRVVRVDLPGMAALEKLNKKR